ncbi:ABC transporter substrate-binding protein [Sphingomonas crocodyli]|nr:ABC transporter substrate-binding protein [Sphingomonas crocodyli]
MALALGLAACGGSKPVQTKDGLTPVSVRVEWLLSSYHAPFFLGIDKGFYKDAGIELTVNEGRGSVQAAQLVGSGQDQFGFGSVDAIMRGAGAGMPLMSVANIMPVMGQAVYVRTASPIQKLQDLKGKSIAITPGGANDSLVPLLLGNVGLKPGDVKLVSADPTAKIRVFLKGDVDAMIAPAWSHSLFDAGGGARAFIFSDYGVKVVGYNIMAAKPLMQSDPDLVRRFVGATLKAWDYSRTHPDEALDALARHSPTNAEPKRRAGNAKDFANALRFVGPAVPGKPYGFQSATDWEESQKLFVTHGVLTKTLPVDQMMTNDFVAPAAN